MKMDYRKSVIGRHGLDCSGSGQGQVWGVYECGDEPLGSIKRGAFLEKLTAG